MTIHTLKTLPVFFWQVGAGFKSFEIRNNDRNFKIGDQVKLHEHNGLRYGKGEIRACIDYILDDFPGIEPNFAILGLDAVFVMTPGSMCPWWEYWSTCQSMEHPDYSPDQLFKALYQCMMVDALTDEETEMGLLFSDENGFNEDYLCYCADWSRTHEDSLS